MLPPIVWCYLWILAISFKLHVESHILTCRCAKWFWHHWHCCLSSLASPLQHQNPSNFRPLLNWITTNVDTVSFVMIWTMAQRKLSKLVLENAKLDFGHWNISCLAQWKSLNEKKGFWELTASSCCRDTRWHLWNVEMHWNTFVVSQHLLNKSNAQIIQRSICQKSSNLRVLFKGNESLW